MITKERLEELIKQGTTIYELYMNKNILEIQLKNDWYVMGDGLYERKLSKHPFRCWQIGNLYETKEDAEFVREFGCIERTERLEFPIYEDIKEGQPYRFNFTSNGKHYNFFTSVLLIELLEVNENENLTEQLICKTSNKENYILACRKAKELFLGE